MTELCSQGRLLSGFASTVSKAVQVLGIAKLSSFLLEA